MEVIFSDTPSSDDNSFGQGRTPPTTSAGANAPTFRTICFVNIPEAGAECVLSPDGNRLAVSLSGGRVATWILPSWSPLPSEQQPPQLKTTAEGQQEDYIPHPRDGKNMEGGTNNSNDNTDRTGTTGELVSIDAAKLGVFPNSSTASPIQLGPVSYTHLTLPTIYSV